MASALPILIINPNTTEAMTDGLREMLGPYVTSVGHIRALIADRPGWSSPPSLVLLATDLLHCTHWYPQHQQLC